ncbi:MAG: hypothetical protein DMD35_06805 [Gemmatimonadetes bacterium]|nr:MAG: hypothetical protein DMD35_06805 [Gemmatimonadota bacterium]
MPETILAPLAGWESYYVIVGSSAAALTGLQFVVMALVAEVSSRASEDQISAFGTPSIVHFCVALLTSATLSAPWRSLASVAVVLGTVGLFGLLYAAIVIRRARRQEGYQPVLEDWLWHAALPVLAYGSLVGGALALTRHEHESLFFVGAATLLLVFIGIHNAWDTVTYITLTRSEQERSPEGERAASESATSATAAATDGSG